MRLLQTAAIVGLSATFAAASAAGAQTLDTVGPHSAYCGTWQNGAFVANGNCIEETTTTTVTTTAPGVPAVAVVQGGRMPGRVSGTITFVRGHLVTLQQATQNLVINDQPALNQQESGRVAVGRSVVAHGYWDNGTFYATRIEGV